MCKLKVDQVSVLSLAYTAPCIGVLSTLYKRGNILLNWCKRGNLSLETHRVHRRVSSIPLLGGAGDARRPHASFNIYTAWYSLTPFTPRRRLETSFVYPEAFNSATGCMFFNLLSPFSCTLFTPLRRLDNILRVPSDLQLGYWI